MRIPVLAALIAAMACAAEPDWAKANPEILRHFQELVRIDTSDPPGNEAPAVDYIKKILEADINYRDVRVRIERLST